jgi:phage gpG-like protein
MRIVVKKALLMVEAEAKRIITKVGYYPSHPKSDIIDTGTLKGRVTNQIVAFSFTNIEGRVGTNVYYAIYVHEGTTSDVSRIFNRWLMAPRPFLVDALRNKEKEIVDMILKTYKSITW